MISMILLLLSAIGCSFYFSPWLLEKEKFGQRLLFGFFFIIFMTVFSGHILNLTLRTSAQIIFAFSILGWAMCLKDREHLKLLLKHPLPYFCLFSIIAFRITAPYPYYETSWDEFSHWLYFPKKLLAHNILPNESFLERTFTNYTPGWPLLLSYLDSAFTQPLQIKDGLFRSMAFSMFVPGLLWDYRDRFMKWGAFTTKGFLFAISFYFLIDSEHIYRPMYAYVEAPLSASVIALIIILFGLMNKESTKKHWFFMGSAYCLAYMIKHSVMPICLPIVVAQLLVLKDDLKKNPASCFLKLILFWAPFIIFYAIWHDRTAHLNALFSFKKTLNFDLISQRVSERGYLIFKMIETSFRTFDSYHFKKYKFVGFCYVMVSIAAIFYARKFKKEYKQYLFMVFYLVTHTLALYWMYMMSFGDHEGHGLASHPRYMHIAYSPFKLLGIFFIAKILIYLYTNLVIPKGEKMALQAFLALALLIVYWYPDFRGLIYRPSIWTTEMLTLYPVLPKTEGKTPEAIIINQEGDGEAKLKTNFYSWYGGRKYFNLYHEWSWGEKSNNIWMQKKQRSDVVKLIKKMDYIYIHKTDKWMDDILADYLPARNCSPPYAQYFVSVNKNSGEFTCFIKRIFGKDGQTSHPDIAFISK